MARKPSVTNTLYKAARLSADIRAIRKGPEAVIKREIRKAVYRKTNGIVAGLLRSILR